MANNPKLMWQKTGTHPLLFIDVWENGYRGWLSRKQRRELKWASTRVAR